MTSFVLIAILITSALLALLVRPLLKTGDSDSYRRHTQNIHFAKQRLLELDQQLKSSRISVQDFEVLKLEIESTLAQDIDLTEDISSQYQANADSSNGVIIALLCGLIPFGGLVVYQLTGTPQALAIATQTTSAPAAAAGLQDIDKMVLSLEQRLQNSPDDIEGWTMLARTYLALGRYPESIRANEKLLVLTGENPDIYAALADASAMQADGSLAGKPNAYVEQALAMNPLHPHALWLAGLSAAQQGKNIDAGNYWNKLLPLLADEPQQQQELRDVIKQTLGQQLPPIIKQADDSSSSTGITVNVSLSESVLALTKPDDTVFVFVKARNGPPAPLAVKRLRVSDLPAEVRLSDADAMVAQFRLSLFADVLVSARVAKAGNPVAQPGDIQSAAVDSSNNSPETIELTISEIVE